MLVGPLDFGFSSKSSPSDAHLSKSLGQFVEKPLRSSWPPAAVRRCFSGAQRHVFVPAAVSRTLLRCSFSTAHLNICESKGNESGTVDNLPLIRPAAEALGSGLAVHGLMVP